MTRSIRTSLVLTVGLLALAALPGCGGSSNTTSSGPSATGAGTTSSSSTTAAGSGTVAHGGPSALGVSPAVGSPHAVLHFTFSAPAGGAAHAPTQISSSLSVLGPRGMACVGVHDQAIPSGSAGRTVTVAVGPGQLGGPWCPGTYTARVEVVQRPKCGQGMMCAQFLRVVAVLGPVTFRIAG